jgi:hypothetical protein
LWSGADVPHRQHRLWRRLGLAHHAQASLDARQTAAARASLATRGIPSRHVGGDGFHPSKRLPLSFDTAKTRQGSQARNLL